MSQAVEDLLWVVNCPSFVQGPQVAEAHTLASEQVDAEHLAAFLRSHDGQASHRVGRYFEQLLHYWLAHVRSVEVVASGLQVKDGKRTIGEIDFLYRNETGELVHCEASVKFFLHLAGHGPSEFPGPNATDNYELKTAKLFDKQLRLSEIHVPQVQHREAFVKGIMFYRSDGEAAVAPERLPDDHLRGRWIRESEVDALASQDGAVFSVADKPHWLAPVRDATSVPAGLFATALREHFSTRGHPLMISKRAASDPGVETERLFVVADVWPAS